jgi:hypothetical protein
VPFQNQRLIIEVNYEPNCFHLKNKRKKLKMKEERNVPKFDNSFWVCTFLMSFLIECDNIKINSIVVLILELYSRPPNVAYNLGMFLLKL